MFKKEITYVDYENVERKEVFYFNLTKAELMEMEKSKTGGLGKTIERIVAEQDIPAIINIFKDLMHKSFGMKSLDGKRFIKDENIWKEFSETEAYSALFMELATNSDAAVAFINGIVPMDMAQKLSNSTKN